MNAALACPATVPRWLTVASAVMIVLGFFGLVLTVFLGFETPYTALLVMSASVTVAAPLAVLCHLIATRSLTTAEKRIWMRELRALGRSRRCPNT